MVSINGKFGKILFNYMWLAIEYTVHVSSYSVFVLFSECYKWSVRCPSLLALWATRLLSQWMLHWRRVKGSPRVNHSLAPTHQRRAWDWTSRKQHF